MADLLPSTAANGLSFQDLQKNQGRQVGRDDALTYKVAGPVDSLYLSKTESEFAPDNENMNVRPSIEEYVDITPTGVPSYWPLSSTSSLTFSFGKEGMTLLEPGRHALQLVVQWPDLDLCTTSPGTGLLDPTTTSYGTRYVSWLGYHALGAVPNDGSPVQIQLTYGNQPWKQLQVSTIYFHDAALVKYNSISARIREEMCGKNPGSGLNADGARLRGKALTTVVDIPFLLIDENKGKTLCLAALADQVLLKLNFPSFDQIVCADTAGGLAAGNTWDAYQTQMRAAGGGWATVNATGSAAVVGWTRPALSATAPFPTVYLRVHGVTLAKAERAALVSNVFTAGTRFKCIDHQVQQEHIENALPTTVIATSAVRHDIPILTLTQPSIFTMAPTRLRLDKVIAASGGSISVANGSSLAIYFGANPTKFSTCNWAPERFACVPIMDYSIWDNNVRATLLFTTKYFRKDVIDKYSLQYDVQKQPGLALIPFTRHANIESHGCGHTTMSNMSNPVFVIDRMAYPFARDVDDRDSFLSIGSGQDDHLQNMFGGAGTGVRVRNSDFVSTAAFANAFAAQVQFSTELISICHQVFVQERSDPIMLYRPY